MLKVAILDDYQRVALKMADWSPLQGRCAVDVFDQHILPEQAEEVLKPYDVVCHLRERMPMPAELLGKLPNLKLLCVTGPGHRTLDMAAANARRIPVCNTQPAPETSHGTPELTWGLILSIARQIPQEHQRMRKGEWQSTVGFLLYGKTLGIVGLGRIGSRVAEYGRAFGMNVLAWSQNLTEERAAKAGVRLVSKDELFRSADVITLHLVLSERSRNTVTAHELGLMKPTAYLVNTSRGPLIEEKALLETLRARRIAGAALDVYDREPLPDDHPIRRLDNVVHTPHLGYVTEEGYRGFYSQTVENIAAFLDGKPVRVLNPDVLS